MSLCNYLSNQHIYEKKIQDASLKKRLTIIDYDKAANLTRHSLREALINDSTVSHEILMENIKAKISESSKAITIKGKYALWNREIAHLDKTRRNISREWRKARKNEAEDAEELFLKFREAQKSDMVTRKELTIKDKNGLEVKASKIRSHLTETIEDLLHGQKTEAANEGGYKLSHPIKNFAISYEDVRGALERVSLHSSAGLDGIQGRILKNLGDEGCEYLARVYDAIVKGEAFLPREWAEARVALIEKPNIKHKKLGEMQHGYRDKRRGDDCLFILTSAIEMARIQNRGLLATFLDCTRAYDKVCRTKLWEVLEKHGLRREVIGLLKLLYKENTVILKTEKEYRIGKFLDYYLFADDLVLIAHTWSDMEKLLQITSTFGEERGLISAKSAVLNFNRVDDTTDKNLFIQGKIIPKERTYKYLGIHLSTDANYLEDQEKMWKERTRKALYQLHAKVLWKFNRFETTKIQWKATCVPALTYCNTVTVMSNTLRKNIDSAQRQAARWALGEPACNLANEFLKGELGWSTFEEREAKSHPGRVNSEVRRRGPFESRSTIFARKCLVKTTSSQLSELAVF
ncbi:uncharacterized protein LOC100900178 [Galendromus occidentalis]|uniref:Uncharacterized protein LOC100900178 n=1 Tax=Galendromus occidentalis TaxID=34638 RepID=A0AAJ7L6N0_9ACAR|nr:uncharacterized protein LOC100900178 [Galendromus occidentalis]